MLSCRRKAISHLDGRMSFEGRTGADGELVVPVRRRFATPDGGDDC